MTVTFFVWFNSALDVLYSLVELLLDGDFLAGAQGHQLPVQRHVNSPNGPLPLHVGGHLVLDKAKISNSFRLLGRKPWISFNKKINFFKPHFIIIINKA